MTFFHKFIAHNVSIRPEQQPPLQRHTPPQPQHPQQQNAQPPPRTNIEDAVMQRLTRMSTPGMDSLLEDWCNNTSTQRPVGNMEEPASGTTAAAATTAPSSDVRHQQREERVQTRAEMLRRNQPEIYLPLDKYGWTPSYEWKPDDTNYVPTFYIHPRYCYTPREQRAQDSPIAQEYYAEQNGIPLQELSRTKDKYFLQMLDTLNESRPFRPNIEDELPYTAYGPPLLANADIPVITTPAATEVPAADPSH